MMKLSGLAFILFVGVAAFAFAQEHGKAFEQHRPTQEETIVCIVEKEKADDPFIRLCELLFQLQHVRGNAAIRFNGVDVTDSFERVAAALLDLDYRLQALEKKQ